MLDKTGRVRRLDRGKEINENNDLYANLVKPLKGFFLNQLESNVR
jgi:hypothetical protein